jgi:hypothetical protein
MGATPHTRAATPRLFPAADLYIDLLDAIHEAAHGVLAIHER